MKRCRTALALLLAAALTGPALALDDESQEIQNTAPVAENQQIETYRGTSVGGQLNAYDADGDALTFELVTEPIKGTVELKPDGCFVYTPAENRRGRDYFSFRAVDEAGNVSQEATVIIKLIKQRTKLTYADMEGSPSEYAAVAMTERGVFTAEYVGADYVFRPEQTVTRGEFLTMCMTAADCELLQGVRSTGFQDDDEISAWLKPYVATALLNGYIPSDALFAPDDAVTLRDACVMLNGVLNVTDVVSVSAYIGEDISEGAQAVANLTASGVMLSDWEDLDAPLTRQDAARLLQNAIELLTRR